MLSVLCLYKNILIWHLSHAVVTNNYHFAFLHSCISTFHTALKAAMVNRTLSECQFIRAMISFQKLLFVSACHWRGQTQSPNSGHDRHSIHHGYLCYTNQLNYMIRMWKHFSLANLLQMWFDGSVDIQILMNLFTTFYWYSQLNLQDVEYFMLLHAKASSYCSSTYLLIAISLRALQCMRCFPGFHI